MKHRPIRRFWISVLITTILMISVVGTGQAKEKITVFLWRAWAQTMSGTLGQWFEGVKEEVPGDVSGCGSRVSIVDGGADPILIAIAGGTPPDATIASVAYALDLYDQGVLRPLNEYWSRSPVNEYTFFPSAQVFNQRDGIIFGAPWSMEAETIVYNIDLFEQNGLDPHPDALANWDELIAAADTLTVRTLGPIRVAGFQSGLSIPNFTGWLYANGGSLYTDDLSGVALESAEGLETLEFLSDLFNVHRVHGLGGIDAFHGGQVGMIKYQLPAGSMIVRPRTASARRTCRRAHRGQSGPRSHGATCS